MFARLIRWSSLLLLACACSPPAPVNIVVVVLDTARPDYLSVYGHPRPTTPFLERFAAEGRRFDRAYSVSGWTLPAHASMLTGRLPAEHGASWHQQRVSDATPLLAERLQTAGYQTAGFSNNAHISQRSGFARGFDLFVPSAVLREPGAGLRHRTVPAVRDWLERERDPERPFFLFVNLIDPHLPYLPPWEMAEPFYPSREAWRADLAHFFPDDVPGALLNRHYQRRDPLSEEEWRRLERLYEGDLRSTDSLVEQLVAAVDAVSDPASTLVFVVSDHGENLGDHGQLAHMFNLYDSNLEVVMLARGPGFEPGSHEPNLVQLTDVYPTAIAAAGLAVEPDLAGRDLRVTGEADRVLTAVLEHPSLAPFDAATRTGGTLDVYARELKAVVGPRFKLIHTSDGGEEIFDLRADPDESAPLVSGAEPPAVAELRDRLEAVSFPGGVPSPELELDAVTLEQMRELGYAN